MSRMYRTDLRPIIMTGAFFAILWSLAARKFGVVWKGFHAELLLLYKISSFRNISVFDNSKNTHLGIFYIVSGSIYMAIVVIEIFGIYAAAVRGLASVRTFGFLSILVTLMIIAVGVIQTIIHFSFKNDILDVCSNVITGDHIFFTGFFGPIDGGIVTPAEAAEWCRRQFDHDSFSNVVALLATSAVSAFFVPFVFAFHRQLRDPVSVANVSREPARMDAYPARYNPPYNPSFQYQAPNGPPPNMSTDAFVPPYEGADHHKPPTYEGGDFEGGNFKGGFADHKDDPFWDGGHESEGLKAGIHPR
ncbi:hypothetical protein BYT27DRAFT_7262244 [Phlegmacium glaucopus]|nr:hypothetical protein BYT27DRAFT_7262244 [Phlegmacium glaucopus]